MTVMKNSVMKTTIFFSAIMVLFATSYATNNDIITEDFRPSDAKTTIIAKITENAAFNSLDIDGNEKISLQESIKESKLALGFNDTDVNHDGVITVDEFAMYQSKKEMNIN